MWNIVLNTELIFQVISLVPKGKRALSNMHVLPVIVSQVVNLPQLLVMRKVNNLGDNKTNIVFVLNVEDFLLIIHDIKGLRHFFVNIILYVLSISLKSDKPAPRELEYFLFRNLVF